MKNVVAGEDHPLFRHVDRGLRRGVAGMVDDVEGVVPDIERELVLVGERRRIGRRIIGMADQEDAVGVLLLHALALLLDRAEGVEISLEAFLQLLVADHGDVREIGVAGNVVAMRLGVDEVADRRLLLHHLAPAHGVDRLLRRVDHDVAIARLDEARIAAGEINLGDAVRSDASHRLVSFVCGQARPRPKNRSALRHRIFSLSASEIARFLTMSTCSEGSIGTGP